MRKTMWGKIGDLSGRANERTMHHPLFGGNGDMASALQDEVFIDTCSSDNELSLKLLAAAATDEVLVAAAKLADRPAFGELWERPSNTAFNMAYRITRNVADAEDVVSGSMDESLCSFEDIRWESKVSDLAHTHRDQSALMTLRRKRAQPETSMEVPDGETWQHREVKDPTKDIEELYIKHERTALLQRAIYRLQPAPAKGS
jgi:RNA polymerase sigma-70 factor (ECF subfamily)